MHSMHHTSTNWCGNKPTLPHRHTEPWHISLGRSHCRVHVKPEHTSGQAANQAALQPGGSCMCTHTHKHTPTCHRTASCEDTPNPRALTYAAYLGQLHSRVQEHLNSCGWTQSAAGTGSKMQQHGPLLLQCVQTPVENPTDPRITAKTAPESLQSPHPETPDSTAQSGTGGGCGMRRLSLAAQGCCALPTHP